MKIKKFTCMECGAPKVNPYSSPYILCDFCGTFTDIDFAVGMEAWNKDPKRTQKYTIAKVNFEQKLAEYLGKNDWVNYEKLQYDYWHFYYEIYPEYLPPSINTEEKYKVYLEICAVTSTEYAFDASWAEKAAQQTDLQQRITYDVKDGKTVADGEAFFRLSDFFIGYVKDSFKDWYENPKYKIMHELLPPDVYLKMKLSLFVQAWIPYLTDEDSDRLIRETKFTTEYTEALQVSGEKVPCQFCAHDLFVPKDSYKVFCEHCHKINAVKTIFNCSSCGAENMVPDNPGKLINCNSCGSENRLIQGWI